MHTLNPTQITDVRVLQPLIFILILNKRKQKKGNKRQKRPKKQTNKNKKRPKKQKIKTRQIHKEKKKARAK